MYFLATPISKLDLHKISNNNMPRAQICDVVATLTLLNATVKVPSGNKF
jgi:hypothetical protein